MAYHKGTIISGHLADGTYKSTAQWGHWKAKSAARIACRLKIQGQATVTHFTTDSSGKGRGGTDDRFTVAAENI